MAGQRNAIIMAIRRLGYNEPTSEKSQVLQAFLRGKDVLVSESECSAGGVWGQDYIKSFQTECGDMWHAYHSMHTSEAFIPQLIGKVTSFVQDAMVMRAFPLKGSLFSFRDTQNITHVEPILCGTLLATSVLKCRQRLKSHLKQT